MRKLRYLVRINKDPHSDWGASVPDLPGCVATGKTIDAALRHIQVATAVARVLDRGVLSGAGARIGPSAANCPRRVILLV